MNKENVSQTKQKFSIMSYNILASRLTHPNNDTNERKEIKAFDYRYPRILAEIEQSGADILCL